MICPLIKRLHLVAKIQRRWTQPRHSYLSLNENKSRMAKDLLARQRASMEVLRSWLSTSVMKTPIGSIPHDFVSSDGKPLFFALIEMLTGRSVPKGESSKNQRLSYAMGGANKRNRSSQERPRCGKENAG